jgi:beta-glucanase (GH16 family)
MQVWSAKATGFTSTPLLNIRIMPKIFYLIIVVVSFNHIGLSAAETNKSPFLKGNQSNHNKFKKEDWQLIWSDEFDHTGLPDSAKWNYDTRGNEYGWGNNEKQWYTVANPKNAYVSNGILKITAHREPTFGKNYSSARLTTKNKGDWKYCKVEVRAKMPTGRGTWPAIWMLPTVNTYGGWPNSGEIDIMEHVGYDPDTVHSTVHTTKYNHIKKTQVGKPLYVKTATTGFHVYTTEWGPEEIRSYVDGELYFSFRNEGTGPEAWPFDQPFHLILNLAIGGGWGGKKGIDDTLFPHVFEIDYVRVYQPVDQ